MSHRFEVPAVVFDSQEPIEAQVTNRAFAEQSVERAFKTAIQSGLVFFTSIPLIDIDWKQALTAIGVTVFLSFLGSILSSRLYVFDSFFQDTAQRAGRTFLATFLGALAGLDALSVNDWKQAGALALSATVLSVVTSGISKNLGTPGTASVLPGADLVPAAQAAIISGQQFAGQLNDLAQAARPYAEEQISNAMNSLRKPGS